ncbi:MAG: hypothetical protein ABIP06_08570 [Pyrinomonadaceae bacterium]
MSEFNSQKAIAEMNERHLKIAKMLKDKAIERLESLTDAELEELSPTKRRSIEKLLREHNEKNEKP